MNSILKSTTTLPNGGGGLPVYQGDNDPDRGGISRRSGEERHHSHSNYSVWAPTLLVLCGESGCGGLGTLAWRPATSSLGRSIWRFDFASSTRYSRNNLIVPTCFNPSESNTIITGLNVNPAPSGGKGGDTNSAGQLFRTIYDLW